MIRRLPFAARWPTRAALPALLVALAIALLGALAAATVSGTMPDRDRARLFLLGVTCWIAGVGLGVVTNGQPAPRGR